MIDPSRKTAWRPQFTLDLSQANPSAFNAIVDSFHEWSKTQPRPTLKLEDGWHVITPEIAEQLLLLNPVGANRKASVATIFYYADQMLANDWQETGQPIIFGWDGNMLDAQHRMWACYLSGASFTTFVVNLRKEIPGIFAYIDNARSRTIKDALFTSGHEGLSGIITQVLDLEWYYVNDAFTPEKGKKKVAKLSPKRALDYVKAHPNLVQGVRLVAGEHSSTVSVIGYREVAAFTAAKLLELHDEETVDAFMDELGSNPNEDTPEGSPITALQVLLEKDRFDKKDAMKKHQILGHVILAFNAWLEGSTFKGKNKLALAVAEPFPKFSGPISQQVAAE